MTAQKFALIAKRLTNSSRFTYSALANDTSIGDVISIGRNLTVKIVASNFIGRILNLDHSQPIYVVLEIDGELYKADSYYDSYENGEDFNWEAMCPVDALPSVEYVPTKGAWNDASYDEASYSYDDDVSYSF